MITEIIIGALVPAVTVGIFVIRYFWKKEKCFTLLKQKIDDLSKESSNAQDIHNTLHEKINDLGDRTIKLETKMDLILDHFDIKSTK